MTVLIDPPAWPAHGRLWSHLASDTSYAELHAFAGRAGVPRRAFEGDHYDVPQERYADLVSAGARPVPSRDLLRALQAAGLRLPKRRGERVLQTWPDVVRLPPGWPDDVGPRALDVLASPFPPPAEATIATRLLVVRGGAVALTAHGLPDAPAGAGRPVGYLRTRAGATPWRRRYLALRTGAVGDGVRWVPLDELTAGDPPAHEQPDDGRDPGPHPWLPLARWLGR